MNGRYVRRASALAAALAAGSLMTSAAVPVTSSAATVDGGEFHVRAASMHTSGLTYLGATTVVTASGGSVAVLQFSADAVTAASPEIVGPCLASHALTTSATGSTSASVALAATSFSATVGGVPVTYDFAHRPTQPFPAELDLSSVDIAAVSMSTAHVEYSGLHSVVGSC